MKIRSRVTHLFGLVAVVSILSVAGYAFTASNTVPISQSGDGAGTVNGYTISNIRYFLNFLDQSVLGSVSFKLNPISPGIQAPKTVKARVVSSSPTLVDCVNISSNNWQCDFPGTTVISLDNLRVVAAQ